jgi:predicted Zn-dependent protease
MIRKTLQVVVVFAALAWSSVLAAESPQAVKFSHGKREVPTYTFGRSETVAPLFRSIENAGYYPYTILDWESRSRRPIPVQYDSLVLENEYLRVEFLPELGGRIWSARDKAANRELFYHTTVIKPGRYNQRGGWPVGNLELYGPFDAHMLTWPGEPWSWALQRQADGSATIVLSHIDHFFRDKISLEVTLRPGRAFLETTIRLRNKNLLPNRYLLWTNAGVAVSEGSRFVYPMTKTIGHVSSALSTWPVIDGVDLSWNKNNKNMLGVFGLDIFDDFMSIYDYKNDYGTICYTNRMLARGMKTWTFGSGLTALRHMAAYTDSDGLYMEMQSGRFIWDGNYEFIEPGKTDGWTEYWYGAANLGGLTTATRDVAVLLDVPRERPGNARLVVTATGVFPAASLELRAAENLIWQEKQDLAVGAAYRTSIQLKEETAGRILSLRIRAQDGKPLLDYALYPDESHPNAVYAKDSIPRKFGPPETLSAEEAFQKGLGHEKFGQLADAEAAYQIALSKDPLFSPAHLRLGLMALDRALNEEAIRHFEQVLERDPTNGDAHYYLAVIHPELGHSLEARRHYFLLLPSSAKYERRDYGLGLLALKENDLPEAVQRLASAAGTNPLDISVRQAHAYVLRKAGRNQEAEKEREALLNMDPTNAFAQAEGILSDGGSGAASRARQVEGAVSSRFEPLDRACAGHSQGYLELTTEYMRLSAWIEAARVLERGIATAQSAGENPYPLLLYYRAYLADRQGDTEAARKWIEAAQRQDLKIEIFPFRSEDIHILKRIVEIAPKDVNAAVLLGDILYSRNRRQEAINIWRSAVAAGPKHFSALRDLGMATLEEGKAQEGLGLLTRASEVRPDHLMTTLLVAGINARNGNAQAAREAFRRALEKTPESDPLTERLASVEAQMGNDQRALELLTTRTFQATHLSYSLLHLYRGVRLMLALQAAKKANYPEALEHVRAASQPPSSLGIDDFATVKSSRLLVFEALLHQAAGDTKAAAAAWKAAAETLDDDVESEGLFRAIALHKVGKTQEAKEWFGTFASVNEQRKTDNAVDLCLHAYCMAGIYDAFFGDTGGAAENFRKALEIDQSYLYARQALAWLEAGMLKGLSR